MKAAVPMLEVRNVSVRFRRGRHGPHLWALDDVSLSLTEGRTMGLVGESGSGKSTLAKAVLGLVPVQRGTISLQGREITRLGAADRRRLGRQLQAVFQDPTSSLNPSYTVGRSLAEPLRAQGTRSRQEVRSRAAQLLEDVGMDPSAWARYPRDFSGGQRQRISIARALMTEPRVVICDDPSAPWTSRCRLRSSTSSLTSRTSTGSAICSSPTTCPSYATSAGTSRCSTQVR